MARELCHGRCVMVLMMTGRDLNWEWAWLVS